MMDRAHIDKIGVQAFLKLIESLPLPRPCRTDFSSERDFMRAYMRQYRRERRAWASAQSRAYQARHPDRYRAQKILIAAVNAGRIKRQPCERCGAAQQVHAHHEDYSKPLDVMWLCPLHHAERHKELRAQAEQRKAA